MSLPAERHAWGKELLVNRSDPIGDPRGAGRLVLWLWPAGFIQKGPGGAVPHELLSDNPQPSDLFKGLCCFMWPGQLGRASGPSDACLWAISTITPQ